MKIKIKRDTIESARVLGVAIGIISLMGICTTWLGI